MNKFSFLASILIGFLAGINGFGQPYFDTYVKNQFVAENSFIDRSPDTSKPPAFSDVRDQLPDPLWPAREDIIQLYWRTWELAFNNIRSVTGNKGFIAPYIDPAFNNNIFTEDCGYMVLFCRYGSRSFNFQQTLDNFYAKQHPDGFICREIRGSNGKDAFHRFDPSSAGINIFPWAEWEYFCNFNDMDRLKKVFPVLLANYQWYSTYRTWPDGTYFSSGWGCGMDNQPRLPEGYHHAFSHGHMSWIDATLQQIYAGKILLKMAELLDRQADVEDLRKEVNHLTRTVNTVMWDPESCIYADRFRDGTLSDVKTIGTFWALLANIVPDKVLPRFLSHLSDTTEFNRPHRIPTLSADQPMYDPMGGYWLGAVWAMTNYSVLRGLTTVKADSLAFEIAMNHVDNVSRIFQQTNVIWENYSPEFEKGNDRENFVGEGGLTGTAILLEYIFGIRPDVPNHTLTWDIRLTDAFGVNQYPFGKEGLIQLWCEKRDRTTDEPQVEISTNIPLTVNILWQGGSRTVKVNP